MPHAKPYLTLLILFLGTLLGCVDQQADTEEAVDPELLAAARAVHENVITIDTHDDIPFDFATAEVDPGVTGERKVDLPKIRIILQKIEIVINQ